MFRKRYLSRLVYTVLAILLTSFLTFAKTVNVANHANSGFQKLSTNYSGLSLEYSLNSFQLNEIVADGITGSRVNLKNVLLPNEVGAPDLAVESRMVMVPNGARAKLKIISFENQLIKDIEIAPAADIPLDTKKGPLKYKKDSRIYSSNEYYPKSPITVSETRTLRGVNYINLAVTPFQYNPVTKELMVYSNIKFDIEFEGGDGQFGVEKYRNRYFDPVIRNSFINSELLPEVEYNVTSSKESEDFEYVIITPDDPDFIQHANIIKNFRTKQGIRSAVFTTTEIGGNTTTAIDNFISEAYNWDIPLVSVLLLGDYGNSGNTITSHTRPHPYSGQCITDNHFADIDEDYLPEINIARITARDVDELGIMVNKLINYETNPPQNSNFYHNPVTALGWQTERWFQICSESIGGFWRNELGKDPVRINAIYSGNPNVDPWSTSPNTNQLIQLFGPEGLGYIPATPAELGGWTGGNATAVNNALNGDGAFMVQHRDHGNDDGWGEPDYTISDFGGLNAENHSYIFSINCLTGKFNNSTESFAEAIHRKSDGALGILAATEVSYSFVNDTFVWGMYDLMWPQFFPDMGVDPSDNDMIIPGFANIAGKYFLDASSWPTNPEQKQLTFDLFHNHGDPYMNIFSEVPQDLTINHAGALLSGVSSYTVTANAGAVIALTVDGEIIGVGTGTSAPTEIEIEPQIPGSQVTMVVTKQNYFRYETAFDIVPPTGPYPVFSENTITDIDGNNIIENGDEINIVTELKNVGVEAATNVTAVLSTESEYVAEITQNSATVASIDPDMGVATLSPAYELSFINNIPDQTNISFKLDITDQTTEAKESYFSVKINAPVSELSHTSDAGFPVSGDIVNYTVSVENKGHSDLNNVELTLSSDDSGTHLDITDPVLSIANVPFGETKEVTFEVTYGNNVPLAHVSEFDVALTAEKDFEDSYMFAQLLNNPVLIETDFSEFPPAGWSTEGGNNWEGGSSNNAGGTAPEAKFNWNPGTVADQYLISPAINASGLNNGIDITYRYSVDYYGAGYELFLVASNDGTNWETLKEFDNTGDVPATFDSLHVDATNFSGYGQDGFRVAFMFSGDSYQINYWYVDDVKIKKGLEPVSTEETLPTVTKLHQNYPNPFNPTTTIRFDLAQTSDVQLMVYNASGQMVSELVKANFKSGTHAITFDAKSISSGVYYYKLVANNKVMTKKMLLVK